MSHLSGGIWFVFGRDGPNVDIGHVEAECGLVMLLCLKWFALKGHDRTGNRTGYLSFKMYAKRVSFGWRLNCVGHVNSPMKKGSQKKMCETHIKILANCRLLNVLSIETLRFHPLFLISWLMDRQNWKPSELPVAASPLSRKWKSDEILLKQQQTGSNSIYLFFFNREPLAKPIEFDRLTEILFFSLFWKFFLMTHSSFFRISSHWNVECKDFLSKHTVVLCIGAKTRTEFRLISLLRNYCCWCFYICRQTYLFFSF